MAAKSSVKLAGRKEWLGLAVLALPTLLVSLDVFLMLMALPTLSKSLHANSVQQLWILDIYGFLLAGFMVTMGSLGDRIGYRKVLLTGAVFFGLASVACAFSTSPLMLIISRAALGIAGATLTPSTLALIRHLFHDERQRTRAISIWITCFIGGSILGPLIGGIMLEHFWWGSVFLLGVPAMLLLLVLAPKLLPDEHEQQGGPLDATSVGLSLVATLSFIYGVKELAHLGWQPVPALMVLLGLVTGFAFLKRQTRLKSPLIELKLFRSPAFSVALGSMLIGTMLSGTIMVFVIQHFQLVEGLSPLHAALWIIPAMVGSIISFQLAPILARRIRPALLIAYGLVVTIAGMVLISQADTLASLVTGFVVVSLGSGPLVTLGTTLVMSSAPPELAGSAGALSQTSNEVGYALGIALLGSLGAVVYRTHLSEHLQNLPAAVANSAHETLAGAVSAAASLPHEAGAALLAHARAGYTSSLHVIAGVSAVLFTIVAILIVVTLRKIKPMGQMEG